jgi:hypothetical protein
MPGSVTDSAIVFSDYQDAQSPVNEFGHDAEGELECYHASACERPELVAGVEIVNYHCAKFLRSILEPALLGPEAELHACIPSKAN